MNLPDFEVKWPCHEAAILPWHGVKAGQERLPVLSSKQTSAWLEVELPPEIHLLARSSSTEDPHHEIATMSISVIIVGIGSVIIITIIITTVIIVMLPFCGMLCRICCPLRGLLEALSAGPPTTSTLWLLSPGLQHGVAGGKFNSRV